MIYKPLQDNQQSFYDFKYKNPPEPRYGCWYYGDVVNKYGFGKLILTKINI
jgi:hypothetical protein